MKALLQSTIQSLPLLGRGKVREKFTSVEAMMDQLLRASPRPVD